MILLSTSFGTRCCQGFWKLLMQCNSWAELFPSHPILFRPIDPFYLETKFLLLKSTHLTLNLKTKLRTFPVGLPSFPIKIWGKSVQGFLSLRSDKQTDRQTHKQKLQLYIFRLSNARSNENKSQQNCAVFTVNQLIYRHTVKNCALCQN